MGGREWRVPTRWRRLAFQIHLALIPAGWRAASRHEAGETRPSEIGGGFAYRLTAWPVLLPEHRTAAIYRALSVMGERVVSVTWLARSAGLPLPEAQEILDWLTREGYAEQITLASR